MIGAVLPPSPAHSFPAFCYLSLSQSPCLSQGECNDIDHYHHLALSCGHYYVFSWHSRCWCRTRRSHQLTITVSLSFFVFACTALYCFLRCLLCQQQQPIWHVILPIDSVYTSTSTADRASSSSLSSFNFTFAHHQLSDDWQWVSNDALEFRRWRWLCWWW